jgi:hypothetical protein
MGTYVHACRLIIACAIKGKRYGEAVDLLMRFGSYCERQELKNTQCKCYLGGSRQQGLLKMLQDVPCWHVLQ